MASYSAGPESDKLDDNFTRDFIHASLRWAPSSNTTLTFNFKAQILKVSDAIRAGKAPEKVLEALARRTTHKDSRKTVTDYLTAKITHA